jgi:hypothetical protein
MLTDQKYDSKVVELVTRADGSAVRLVNLLAEEFSCFRDECVFEGRKVRFLKRAQIFVADLWAAFEGEGYGMFEDINEITMFAGTNALSCALNVNQSDLSFCEDYRIPQRLYTLGCLSYSPPLEWAVRQGREIESGHSWEVQLRGMRMMITLWCSWMFIADMGAQVAAYGVWSCSVRRLPVSIPKQKSMPS